MENKEPLCPKCLVPNIPGGCQLGNSHFLPESEQPTECKAFLPKDGREPDAVPFKTVSINGRPPICRTPGYALHVYPSKNLLHRCPKCRKPVLLDGIKETKDDLLICPHCKAYFSFEWADRRGENEGSFLVLFELV